MTAIADQVRAMNEQANLSHQDVGRILGTSGRTVARWASGEATPHPDARQRLLELAYVADELHEVLGLTGENANLWIFSPSRLLDGDTPADRIRAGDYRSVHDLIQALAEGVII